MVRDSSGVSDTRNPCNDQSVLHLDYGGGTYTSHKVVQNHSHTHTQCNWGNLSKI